MAPLRPLPGKSAPPPKSILKRKAEPVSTATQPGSLFSDTKKDKRRIKHAQLMSKVTKSTTSKPRNRRPSKKLVTTLDALADALPDEKESGSEKATAGLQAATQVNIIKRKSMKSRPGAMKRKQKLDNNETDRFAKNLAQMAATAPGTAPASSAEKLRALRGFISQTLEKRTEVTEAGG